MLSILDIIEDTTVDGPGFRTSIYAAGCPNRCPGCHNPATHDFNGGKDCALEKILAAIDENPLLDGVELFPLLLLLLLLFCPELLF